MRRNAKTLLLLFSLVTTLGCTIFSAGPYVLEFRYDPSPTPTPLPSPIPPAPAPSPQPTIAGDWTVTNLTINMPNGQLACNAATFISFNITNVGSAATPEIEARVLQIGPSRLQLFSEAFAPVPALEPGASHFVEVSLPLHTTPNNRYMIRALVDFPNAINEPIEPNNEQNTSVEVTCGASPNLRVSGLGTDGVNCTGDTEIRFTVVNDGSADAPGSALYISVVDTEVLSVPMVPALAFGTSATGSTVLPLHTLPDGNYTLRAKADASLTIFEGNESDNITETSITVACGAGPTPAPTSGTRPTAEVFPTATVDVNAADLVITALTAIGTGVNPRCGENTRVDFMVENRGVSAAGANVIYIADYNDFVITSDAYYGIPPLQPGESYSGTANIVHTLQAQVNSGFTVNEFNTANNYLAISYNVDDAGHCPPAEPAPTATVDASAGTNLILIEVRLTASGVNPRCGEAASIDFVVRNNGTAAVASTTLSLSDHVADTYQSAGFARVNLPALDVGATHNGSASILITHSPNVLHRLVVNVDDTSAVSEANEDDNVATILYNVEDSGSCN